MELAIFDKKALVLAALRKTSGVVVALSGGVDSGVLLALAAEALGSDRVLAVTGFSASVSGSDLEDARRVAAACGVRHEAAPTHELDRPAYTANAGDRCYHCRTELFEVLGRIARREGLRAIAYGAIVGDLAEERPGMRAASEHQILAPLLDAGLDKNDVRALAEAYGLVVRDKPASPCLSSRIPVGSTVTPQKLSQIERAEAGLRALGLKEFRVRHHGEIARLHADAASHALLADPALRADAVRRVKDAGFRFAVLDLEPFRGGEPAVTGPLYSIRPARPGGQ